MFNGTPGIFTYITVSQHKCISQGLFTNDVTFKKGGKRMRLWQGKDGYPSMTLLYLHAMDRLWQICPDCLFLIEGAIQLRTCSAMLQTTNLPRCAGFAPAAALQLA